MEIFADKICGLSQAQHGETFPFYEYVKNLFTHSKSVDYLCVFPSKKFIRKRSRRQLSPHLTGVAGYLPHPLIQSYTVKYK
jgi:hypothetical protein